MRTILRLLGVKITSKVSISDNIKVKLIDFDSGSHNKNYVEIKENRLLNKGFSGTQIYFKGLLSSTECENFFTL